MAAPPEATLEANSELEEELGNISCKVQQLSSGADATVAEIAAPSPFLQRFPNTAFGICMG